MDQSISKTLCLTKDVFDHLLVVHYVYPNASAPVYAENVQCSVIINVFIQR